MEMVFVWIELVFVCVLWAILTFCDVLRGIVFSVLVFCGRIGVLLLFRTGISFSLWKDGFPSWVETGLVDSKGGRVLFCLLVWGFWRWRGVWSEGRVFPEGWCQSLRLRWLWSIFRHRQSDSPISCPWELWLPTLPFQFVHRRRFLSLAMSKNIVPCRLALTAFNRSSISAFRASRICHQLSNKGKLYLLPRFNPLLPRLFLDKLLRSFLSLRLPFMKSSQILPSISLHTKKVATFAVQDRMWVLLLLPSSLLVSWSK